MPKRSQRASRQTDVASGRSFAKMVAAGHGGGKQARRDYPGSQMTTGISRSVLAWYPA